MKANVLRKTGMVLILSSVFLGTAGFEQAHAGAGTTPRHGIFREAGPQPSKGGDVIIAAPKEGASEREMSVYQKGSFDITGIPEGASISAVSSHDFSMTM